MVWETYTWLFGVSIVMALFMAWGIGANDVANAFGTTVGAKALTIKQVIIVASFCEFGGAVLLGSGVTDTVKNGIAKVSAYTYEPELLMYGMVCALFAAAIWLALATFLELPVSTTHSIVGAFVGMSLAAAGTDSVLWYTAPKPGSPFPGGVVSIILAWFITPLMAAVMAALLFLFTKLVVLNAKNPFKRSLLLFPLYTFITIWVITYFVIQKGVNGWMKNETYTTTEAFPSADGTYNKPSCPAGGETSSKNLKNKTSSDKTSITFSLTGCQIEDATNAWIAAVTAAAVTAICIVALKWVVKLVERDMATYEASEARLAEVRAGIAAGHIENGNGAAAKDVKATAEVVGEELTADAAPNRTPAMLQSMRRSKVWTSLAYGSNYDIHESVADDEKIMAMHDHAEVFDRKTEMSFKYLQVLTACANSFAHGANDVANAIGAMAGVYSIWQCACANSKANVPIWMFVLGGFGLILGLATYGYKIIRVLGVKMMKLTNSRGYCAELTAAIVVIISSRYGFPVSTTQVITGAITGVGLLEVVTAKIKGEKNASQHFNFLLLLKFFGGWVFTLIFAGATAALFTAQGIYAPSRPAVDYRYELNKAYNATNYAAGQALVAAGNVTGATPDQMTVMTWGQGILNATKRTWDGEAQSNLDTLFFTNVFQNASWYLGNATQLGVLVNTFMPIMPQVSGINLS